MGTRNTAEFLEKEGAKFKFRRVKSIDKVEIQKGKEGSITLWAGE